MLDKTFGAIFLLSLLFPIVALAQGLMKRETPQPAINVNAVVRPRHIQLGEKARLDLTISGDTFINHIEAPQFNFLPAFLAVPIASETTPRLETDKIAVSMAWAYDLIPQAIGDFTLSDIRFAYQGTSYFANPGPIRVSGTDTYIDTSINAVHRVDAKVDTARPYLNAPLTYTFRYLYTAVLPTRDSPTPRLPTFPGFRVETVATAPSQTEQIRGRTYWIETHVRHLYPEKTGQIVIQPAALLLPLATGQKTLKTEPIKLNVQPLPAAGKPPNFSGAIGEYQISAQLAQAAVRKGKAFTVSVRISGRGNIETVTAPQLPHIPGVIVNRPNPVGNPTPTSRRYTYGLVPSQSGLLRIPAIGYTYFNPKSATYATAYTDPIPVSVRPNPNEVLPDLEPEGSPWTFWLILFGIVLVVVLIGAFLWYRGGFMKQRRERNRDTQPAAAVPTPSDSQTHEGPAARLHIDTTENAATFANTLAQALYEHLEETLTLSERSIAAAHQACRNAQIPDPIADELIDLLTKCDYHRFAPVTLETDEKNALIARAEAVIDNIETDKDS